MSELDDLVRNQRFQEIHDARRQVIEDERALNEALATGRVNDSDARRLFQRAVDAYVRELEYLLAPPDSDEVSDYWNNTKVGQIELPDGSEAVIDGLGPYLDLPEVLEVEVTRTDSERYYELDTTRRKTVEVQPPWSLLRSAFRTANAAVSELGLELDVDGDDSNRWEFREIEDVDDLNPEEWNDITLGNGTNGDAPEVSE